MIKQNRDVLYWCKSARSATHLKWSLQTYVCVNKVSVSQKKCGKKKTFCLYVLCVCLLFVMGYCITPILMIIMQIKIKEMITLCSHNVMVNNQVQPGAAVLFITALFPFSNFFTAASAYLLTLWLTKVKWLPLTAFSFLWLWGLLSHTHMNTIVHTHTHTMGKTHLQQQIY